MERCERFWGFLPLWLRFLLAPILLALLFLWFAVMTIAAMVYPIFGAIIAIATRNAEWVEYGDDWHP